jgi:hypothetical protein
MMVDKAMANFFLRKFTMHWMFKFEVGFTFRVTDKEYEH